MRKFEICLLSYILPFQNSDSTDASSLEYTQSVSGIFVTILKKEIMLFSLLPLILFAKLLLRLSCKATCKFGMLNAALPSSQALLVLLFLLLTVRFQTYFAGVATGSGFLTPFIVQEFFSGNVLEKRHFFDIALKLFLNVKFLTFRMFAVIFFLIYFVETKVVCVHIDTSF